MPPVPGEQQAIEARRGLFRGRSCTTLRKTHGNLSVSVMFRTPDGDLTNTPARTSEGYVLVVRVWSRDVARKEITRRVDAGEQLHYNVMRNAI